MSDVKTRTRITEACCGQTFPGTAAVDFIWTVTPYRTEWRYVTEAHKYALLDSRPSCENQNEFAVYAAPVGKLD